MSTGLTNNEKTQLREAFQFAHKVKWEGTRHGRKYLLEMERQADWFEARGITHLDQITKAHIVEFAKAEKLAGNGETTIAWKLAALGAANREAFDAECGFSSREKLPKLACIKRKAPKWWLTPEDKEKLTEILRRRNDPVAHLAADYIDFVCLTGLRVEEALRLGRQHFRDLDGEHPVLFVPGTKTDGSAGTLPMCQEAAEIVRNRFAHSDSRMLFPVGYPTLSAFWLSSCRPIVDPHGDHPTATLRALRRTFGWYATQRKMPTAVLQKFYRHSNINTTTGYLNLIGSTDVETLRAYL